MSTNPGVTSAPSASSTSLASSSTWPTAAMRPSFTPTSAVRRGTPVPSTSVPPRMIRSSMQGPPKVPTILPDLRRRSHQHAVLALALCLPQRVVRLFQDLVERRSVAQVGDTEAGGEDGSAAAVGGERQLFAQPLHRG